MLIVVVAGGWWTECTIVYWMVGLRRDMWHYFAFFVLVITLAAWSAEVRSQHALHVMP
jgi:hypothetical protein